MELKFQFRIPHYEIFQLSNAFNSRKANQLGVENEQEV
jgi:hypothetical protein